MIVSNYTPSSIREIKKDIINVGTSETNIKTIKLGRTYKNPKFYPRKLGNNPDRFSVEIDGDLLRIQRIDDRNLGWGAVLLIDVEYESKSISQSFENQKIPKVIYQTFKENDIPKGMYDSIQSWKDLNSEYEHYYFTDEQQIEFIEKYFDSSVLDAYLSLIPGAFRTDLWRCCVLYEKGGVYVDVDMICLIELSEFISPDDEFIISRDDPMSKSYLYNAFIASTPRHPFLKEQIDSIVENVRIKKDCYFLDVSGPGLLGKSVNKVLNRDINTSYELGTQSINNFNIKILKHSWESRSIMLNDLSLILDEYPGKNLEMKTLNEVTYYDLYNKQMVYQEIPRNIYYTTHDCLGINNYMVDSFTEKNKFWKLNHYDSNSRLLFFEKHNDELKNLLGVNPLEFYLSLKNGGEQADFWRYCIVYLFGGFYTDSDTFCNQPLDSWIRKYDLVLGIEANLEYEYAKSFGMHMIGKQVGDNVISVCNWSFGSKPKHDFFKKLIIDICNNPIKHDVILNTGPARFTKHALEYFSGQDLSNIKNGSLFKNKSVLFDINKFGSNQSHSKSYKNFENPFDIIGVDDVYVIHKFEGSWRNLVNNDIKIIPSDYKIVTNLTITKTDNGFKGVSRLDIDYNRTEFMIKIADCRSILEINFDKNFNVISELEKPITNIDRISKFEDSRFFKFKNKNYLSTSYINENFDVKVCILDENYKFLGDVNIDEYNRVSFTGKNVIWEKNWLFFEKGDDLFFIYSTTPKFVVYKCSDFDKLIFEKYIDIDWPLKENVPDSEIYFTGYIGCNRKVATAGSTPPIFIKEKNVYLYTIHTKFYGERKYNHYIVILDNNLNPIKLVSEPMITKHVPYRHMFVNTMIENDNFLVISGGISDTINFIWELSKPQILKLIELN